ncbi:O-fucosyltransferase 6-like isoform X1 [Phragmites australis]|uniref:O-fucosyltransferase 6-like isoform X1 n=1 Tax=Phragmites australis TaxID=29695 RepID=UPI002D78ED25|nr:O-fucosyltransferase 6-like isoform X1 [Phragmites australis]
MGSRRRRHHYHRRWVVPAVAPAAAAFAAAGLLLVVVAFHCFLSPPLGGGGARVVRRPNPPFLQLNKPEELRRNVIGTVDFSVPSGGSKLGEELWESKAASNFFACSNATKQFADAKTVTKSDRYLMIATSGGLNQQRTGIIDAVLAARILNATLVVPKLDQKSFWKDASDFAEIFDVDSFISTLSNDVKIIRQVPDRNGKMPSPYKMRIPRKCTPKCYENRVLPALLKKHVVQLTKFDYRMSNRLETDLQKLRCRVNYHALQFTDPILKMGETLVQRMRAKSGRFIALHLRFEPDMLAFSGCYYGGGDIERIELGEIRKRWKTLHASNPDRERRHGKCPLTPEEVGLMLRALGFGKDVHLYVASGDVYGGEETLAPLKALFPNFHSKETLASKEELAPFLPYSSRMAALDFIVCDGSDVFMTNNNGNMARMLAGRRRYFGHKRTIRPNAKKLYSLFLNRTSMSWDTFASKVQTFQKGFVGEPNEIKPGRGEFHEYPIDCICARTKGKTGHSRPHLIKHVGAAVENQSSDGDLDWRDLDYGEHTPLGRDSSNEAELDDNRVGGSDIPELEDMISD